MLDSTDFGHSVGEIDCKREIQQQRTSTSTSSCRILVVFANKTDPKGKMTAYFELFGFPTDACT